MIENDQRIANLEIGNNLTSLRLQNGNHRRPPPSYWGFRRNRCRNMKAGQIAFLRLPS